MVLCLRTRAEASVRTTVDWSIVDNDLDVLDQQARGNWRRLLDNAEFPAARFRIVRRNP